MLVFDFFLQQRCGGLGVRRGYANQVGIRGQKPESFHLDVEKGVE